MLREKILEQLKAKNSGVSQRTLDTIADRLSNLVKEEKEIEGAITEFEKYMPVKSFEDALKRESDMRVTDAVKTFENNLKQKFDFVEKGKTPDQKKTDEPDSMKVLIDKMAEMEKRFEDQQNTYRQQSLRATAVSKLKEKKIPEYLLKGYDIKTDQEIDSVIQQVESDYNKIKQEMVNSGIVADVPAEPKKSAGPSSDVLNYIKEKGENLN
jgi:hypothetical protein